MKQKKWFIGLEHIKNFDELQERWIEARSKKITILKIQVSRSHNPNLT